MKHNYWLKTNRDKKFNRCILSESWDYVYTSDSQGAYTEFQRVIDRHFENSFPMLTFTMTYKNRHPWMTVLLRKQITEKKTISINTSTT